MGRRSYRPRTGGGTRKTEAKQARQEAHHRDLRGGYSRRSVEGYLRYTWRYHRWRLITRS